MSFQFHEDNLTSRRSYLRWMAVAALSPLVAKAACPCGPDEKDTANVKTDSVTTQPSAVLRVCVDPNNLPFSNRNHEGFEDQIAALIARELGKSLEYDWLPQRLGFYRTALKTFDSDLVMAAPGGFEKALITDPYYRSTYVFIHRRKTPAPKNFDDPALKAMKIGVQLVGSDTPPTHALAKRKLIDNLTGYPVFDETDGKPAAKIINAVASSEIDLAIVWGPQAGYFVKQQADVLQMTPVSPQLDGEGPDAMPFTFSICMAVRRSDEALRRKINIVIANRRKEIDQILDTFAVPRLEMEANPSSARS